MQISPAVSMDSVLTSKKTFWMINRLGLIWKIAFCEIRWPFPVYVLSWPWQLFIWFPLEWQSPFLVSDLSLTPIGVVA